MPEIVLSEQMTTSLINIHLSLCFVMIGVIWVIQLVHYPSFKYIDQNEFIKFERFHMNRISFIVVPIMTLELLTAIILTVFLSKTNSWHFFNTIFLVFTWFFTFFVSARLHKRLLQRYSLDLIQKLTSSNWARTTIWSIRGLLGYYFLAG